MLQNFDKVWHPEWIHKVSRIFAPGVPELLKSYLGNQQFFVKRQSEQSHLLPVLASVSQGSFRITIIHCIHFEYINVQKNKTAYFCWRHHHSLYLCLSRCRKTSNIIWIYLNHGVRTGKSRSTIQNVLLWSFTYSKKISLHYISERIKHQKATTSNI